MKRYVLSTLGARFLVLALLMLSRSWALAQVIANGIFAVDGNCSNNNHSPDLFYKGCVQGWYQTHGETEIAERSYPGHGPGALLFGHFGCSTGGGGGGIFTALTLTPSRVYTFTFEARTFLSDTGFINIYLTKDLSNSQLSCKPASMNSLLLSQQNLTPTWTTFTVQFTAPSWSSPQLWIEADGWVRNVVFSPCDNSGTYYQNTNSVPAETRVQNKIIAGSAVTSGLQGPVNVSALPAIFRSATEIQLLPEFSAVPTPNSTGDWFAAEILLCPTNNPYNTSGCNCLAGPNSRISTLLTTGQAITKISMVLYPNPTVGNSSLAYNLTIATNVSVDVIDILGKAVVQLATNERQAAGSHVLIIPTLPLGVYTVRLLCNGSYEYRKLLSE